MADAARDLRVASAETTRSTHTLRAETIGSVSARTATLDARGATSNKEEAGTGIATTKIGANAVNVARAVDLATKGVAVEDATAREKQEAIGADPRPGAVRHRRKKRTAAQPQT
jgi:hypothetical protein